MELSFSCADYTFPLLSHEKVLDLIALLDFTTVDIGFFQDRSHVQPRAVFEADKGGQVEIVYFYGQVDNIRPEEITARETSEPSEG